MPNNSPDINTLRRLRPLSMFADDQLQSLSYKLEVRFAQNNDVILKLGNMEEYSLFVLQGDITLSASDGKTKAMSFNDSDELNPVAQLRPSLYEVKATSPVRYLKIDTHLLTEFAQLTESAEEDISLHIIEEPMQENPLALHLFKDLMTDSIKLPSLPEVAHRIQQAYRSDNIDADQVAKILLIDPAISGKLIKIANSPVYAGLSATDTLQAAVVRLGMDTTYKQVMAYAVNELFRSQSRDVSDRMEALWAHSRKVAAISRVLAKTTGLFDPDQAMLAGLTHDIGVIVIVDYLQQYSEEKPDQKTINNAIETMRPQITGMLMRKWNFSEETVKVAEECENWFRNPRDDADLCDLVMIAQYHSLIGSHALEKVPPINTLPAMTKLKMGPAESIELIRESNKEISEIERMFH